MAWVILRVMAEVAFSQAMQVGHPKTTEVYENAEACKVRGQVLAICSLSKTAVCGTPKFTVRVQRTVRLLLVGRPKRADRYDSAYQSRLENYYQPLANLYLFGRSLRLLALFPF